MPKYIKKPIEIEAWEWDETLDTLDKIGCGYASHAMNVSRPGWLSELKINTLEGTMSVNKGDYIIKGIKGEFYPCKKEIFEETYNLIK